LGHDAERRFAVLNLRIIPKSPSGILPELRQVDAGLTIGYLLIVTTMLAFLEPEGLGWTLGTGAAGMGAGTAAFLLAKRAGQRGLTSLFGKNRDTTKG